ncbi:spartin a isoform X1 [Haplochromis burtoni]|uniref:Spartin n=1 Tax=Haplochromis burtoni TaxID=8153 RepID=A0A3Q3BSS4_HAPBU|nr:spartin a isoform X1 [Haplochromis burtoni]XP_005928156.1 spartin a isoform X1 [Haplochromis burtoni]XP_005928157.1 spartin a isoform X1 [Haplochromis burtoni]
MGEPAELLLIRDQYELAFHSLSRGLAAEEAEKRAEALEYYRKGRLHLTQGLEVPTGGQRQQGANWDTARQLQQKMRDTLKTIENHLSDLETSQLTITANQRDQLLKDLSVPQLYPDLAPNGQPPQNSVHHLYPTIPTTTHNIVPTPNTVPVSPATPPAPDTFPAVVSKTIAMASPAEQPPAYTPQPTDGHRILAYAPVEGGFCPGRQTAAVAGENGTELLCIPSGVQLFFVAPNGQVSSLSSPGYLRIMVVNSQQDSPAEKPAVFLHVCDWMYPLTKDTPVLLANSGIFMFPDSLAEMPGCYAGIVLSSELPPADLQTFQDLLSQLAEFRIQGPEGTESEVVNLSTKVPLNPTKEQVEPTTSAGEQEKLPLPGWSEKMGQGILTGALRLSDSLIKGAEATGRAIHKGAAKIRDQLTPEETPSEVSPSTTKRLEMARKATGGAVRVSQFLVNGVGTVAEKLAEKMAPHVKKHGAKLVPEALKKKEDGQASKMDGAKFVAVSTVHGLATIWSSLETGAKLVGKSVAAETVSTVTYKYGNNAGEATDTGLQSVINIGVTANNIDNAGIKAFFKKAGKCTAKELAAKSNEEKKLQKEVQEDEAEAKDVQKNKEEEKKK